MSLFYYDFETTGLNPYHEKIIEYSFIRQDNEAIQSLINPKAKFSDKIEMITQITNSMVEQAPTIEEKKDEITSFLNIYNSECVYLVAHNNSNFDRFFFKNIYKSDAVLGPILNTKVKHIDSIHLAKYLLPELKTFNLKFLCKKFNIVPGTHRAMDDTIALKLLFERLVWTLSFMEDIEYAKLIKNPQMIYNILY
jgi:DNA polymerase-3 subunit alpha (Gram-positive type)